MDICRFSLFDLNFNVTFYLIRTITCYYFGINFHDSSCIFSSMNNWVIEITLWSDCWWIWRIGCYYLKLIEKLKNLPCNYQRLQDTIIIIYRDFATICSTVVLQSSKLTGTGSNPEITRTIQYGTVLWHKLFHCTIVLTTILLYWRWLCIGGGEGISVVAIRLRWYTSAQENSTQPTAQHHS